MDHSADYQEEYLENPNRAIQIFGKIDEKLFRALIPKVKELRDQQPEEPITVYIDSEGGFVHIYERIACLLFEPDQLNRRCPIITVVIGGAASAAARLFVRGDYRIAYPGAEIYFHGVRVQDLDLTREKAIRHQERLSLRNREASRELIPKIIYGMLWRNFVQFKGANKDLEQLLSFLDPQLGHFAITLLTDSYERICESSHLDKFLDEKKYSDPEQPDLKGDFKLLKLIIDFFEKSSENEEDALSVEEYLKKTQDLFRYNREKFSEFLHYYRGTTGMMELLCTAEETKEADKIDDPDKRDDFLFKKVGHDLFQFWQFASFLSDRLQEGENPIESFDAYWLGLVDEVATSELPNMREIVGMKRDHEGS